MSFPNTLLHKYSDFKSFMVHQSITTTAMSVRSLNLREGQVKDVHPVTEKPRACIQLSRSKMRGFSIARIALMRDSERTVGHRDAQAAREDGQCMITYSEISVGNVQR